MATRTASKIQWVNTPPARPVNFLQGAPVKYREFAEALKARPGKWALFSEYAGKNLSVTSQAIKKGVLHAFSGEAPGTPGGFEATVRSGQIYVRYVGK